MLHDVACGMMYIHERRYVHSDLRSANLFVKEGGRVVVGNFACAQRLDCGQDTVQADNYTKSCWTAPELLSACEMSYGSDVYSFGTIMYELLTFKDAFENLSTSNLLMA
jgi:serine/threonine protein kinase